MNSHCHTHFKNDICDSNSPLASKMPNAFLTSILFTGRSLKACYTTFRAILHQKCKKNSNSLMRLQQIKSFSKDLVSK